VSSEICAGDSFTPPAETALVKHTRKYLIDEGRVIFCIPVQNVMVVKPTRIVPINPATRQRHIFIISVRGLLYLPLQRRIAAMCYIGMPPDFEFV